MQLLRPFFESMEGRIDPVWRREIQSQFDMNSLLRRFVPSMAMVVAVAVIFLFNSQNMTRLNSEQSRNALIALLGFFSAIPGLMSVLSIQSKKKQGWFIPEKQSKALFFLLSTPISSTQVVLSKLIPAWWDSVLVLLVSVPLVVMGVAFGFWGTGTVVLLYFVALLVLFGVRLGELQASIHAKDIKGMRGKTSLETTFLVLALIIGNSVWNAFSPIYPAIANSLSSVWDQIWIQGLTAALFSISPWGPVIPLLSVFDAQWPVPFHQPMLMLAISIVARLGFTAWALWRTISSLRPVAIGQMLGEPSERLPRRKRFEEFLRRVRPPVWEDYPLAWRKMFIGKNSVVRGTLVMLAIVSLVMLGSVLVFRGGITFRRPEDFLFAFYVFVFCTLFVIFFYGSGIARQAVTQEQLSETWLSILATPITNAQLVGGLLLPAIVSALSTVIAMFLVVAGSFLFNGIELAGMVSLPIVMVTWLVLLAACGMMAIVNSTPKERGAADRLVWTVGIFLPMLIVLVVSAVTTELVLDNYRYPDDRLNGITVADSLAATGFLWCWQTTTPGEFTWRMFLGVPALVMYVLIFRWFWPRAVRRFGVVNERRD